jgi:hypothetical protein
LPPASNAGDVLCEIIVLGSDHLWAETVSFNSQIRPAAVRRTVSGGPPKGKIDAGAGLVLLSSKLPQCFFVRFFQQTNFLHR